MLIRATSYYILRRTLMKIQAGHLAHDLHGGSMKKYEGYEPDGPRINPRNLHLCFDCF